MSGTYAQTLSCSFILILAAISMSAQAKPPKVKVVYDQNAGQVSLENGRIRLTIETKHGLNANKMEDVKTGIIYADSDYFWPEGHAPQLMGEPNISKGKAGQQSVKLKAKLGLLEITQTFSVSAADENALEEVISIKNIGDTAVDLPNFASGFRKHISKPTESVEASPGAVFTAVPFRVKPGRGELSEYSLDDLINKKDSFSYAQSGWQPVEINNWPSEAWVWSQNGVALLISKYNPEDLEWSLLEAQQSNGKTYIRYGGAGIAKAGDPQGATHLAPGAIFTFGTTRFQIMDGNWEDGYYAYRALMTSKGHGTPSGYNPPVHWNELYDNKLWWNGDYYSPESRAEFYKMADMRVEAEKAKEFGCEALYLDPGWDTRFGSMLWAADRLGSMEDFHKWLSDSYGLKLALHTPLAPWTDATSYPLEARLMDKDGNRRDELCAASVAYQQAVVERHLELCKNGGYFLMYDGSAWPGECWDPSHGHSVPLTHKEHVDAIVSIAQKVHKQYPKVVIEQHDPITGPSEHRYCPMYFMHDKTGAFNEHWADEHMWDPMRDLMERRSMSQYYFNLAYGLPTYLHIDLRSDNRECLVFWWNASTCRHLGVGGKHSDPEVWEAQKRAMKDYLKYKPFFTRGVFYGLDETVHVHSLSKAKRAVIDFFNLTDSAFKKVVRFKLSQIGLPAGNVSVENAIYHQDGDEIELNVGIPAKGHRLVILKCRGFAVPEH